MTNTGIRYLMLEMAQIPVNIFQDKIWVKTITLTGPDHGRKNFVIEEELGVSTLYLKLRFAQTGMEVKGSGLNASRPWKIHAGMHER